MYSGPTNHLSRNAPASATAIAITAAPSGTAGLDISGLARPSTAAGPRFAYLMARGNAGSVTIAADSEIYVKRGDDWIAVGVFRAGKAITVTTAIWAEDFLQGVGDAERITLHCPTAGGAVDLAFGFYDQC